MSVMVEKTSEARLAVGAAVLEMYHHVAECDSSGAPKGIVLDMSNPGVAVCHTSVYTPEYTTSSIPDSVDWSSSVVVTSEEGTLLRVFHHGSKWYVSTHKKLDSAESRWGSKYSFRTLFDAAVKEQIALSSPTLTMACAIDLDDAFYSRLDKALVYTFLLRTNEYSRVVCDAPRGGADDPKVLFAGMYRANIPIPIPDPESGVIDLETIIPFPDMDAPPEVAFIPSIQRHSPQTTQDVVEIVSNTDYRKSQGVVVFTRSGAFRVVCKEYAELRTVRDNQPNILFRYAQVRIADPATCAKLVGMFAVPHGTDFSWFEDTIRAITRYTFIQYVRRYFRREYAAVPPPMYVVTKQVREWHMANPFANIVTPRVVMDTINAQAPETVMRMVREFCATPSRGTGEWQMV